MPRYESSAPEGGSKNEKYGRFSTHPQVDEAISLLGTRQHLVFGLDQLCTLGLSARAAQKRTDNSRLHRIHQTVYSLVPPELLTRDGWFMAAVLACGPGALLSHRSAAALHGLVNGWGRIEVTVPGRNRRRHDGVLVHRSTS